MNETDFLKKITANDSDRTERLKYADWLEEKGDPRGELIRLEETMRVMPVFTDEYWNLKPRRNELRALTDQQWLTQMRYGTDYEPTLTNLPDDWKGRWRAWREFTERWCQIPMPDVGGRTEEIAEKERELGFPLPPAMREWMAYWLDLYDLFEKYNFGGLVVRDCLEVSDLKELGAVSLLIQGEEDYYWAVKKEFLKLDDPPVEGFYLDYDAELPDTFTEDRQWASRVTSLPLLYFSEWSLSQVNTPFTKFPHHPDLLEALKARFPNYAKVDHLLVFEQKNLLIFYDERDHQRRIEAFNAEGAQSIPALPAEFQP